VDQTRFAIMGVRCLAHGREDWNNVTQLFAHTFLVIPQLGLIGRIKKTDCCQSVETTIGNDADAIGQQATDRRRSNGRPFR